MSSSNTEVVKAPWDLHLTYGRAVDKAISTIYAPRSAFLPSPFPSCFFTIASLLKSSDATTKTTSMRIKSHGKPSMYFIPLALPCEKPDRRAESGERRAVCLYVESATSPAQSIRCPFTRRRGEVGWIWRRAGRGEDLCCSGGCCCRGASSVRGEAGRRREVRIPFALAASTGSMTAHRRSLASFLGRLPSSPGIWR